MRSGYFADCALPAAFEAMGTHWNTVSPLN
jgi:hypothetical protein